MEEKKFREFLWIALFFVTGFSFLLFSLLLSIMNGTAPRFFIWAGVIATSLGLVSLLLKKMGREQKKKLTEN